jgi:hypothetical protein
MERDIMRKIGYISYDPAAHIAERPSRIFEPIALMLESYAKRNNVEVHYMAFEIIVNYYTMQPEPAIVAYGA